MAYNNLQDIVTSAEGTWTGTTISYNDITLEEGIPHKDQLEVERVFALPTTPTNIKDNISAYDLHRVFILGASEYTVNEANKTITAFNITAGARSYFTVKATTGLAANTEIAIPIMENGQTVVIRRKTYTAGPYINWTSGSRLTSTQLNLQVQQLLKVVQELTNKINNECFRFTDVIGSSAPSFSVDNNLNMQNYRIINLGNPSSTYGADTTTVVNKAFLEAHYVNKGQNVTETITGNKTFSGSIISITNNVGIGTNSPVRLLHLHNPDVTAIQFTGSNSGTTSGDGMVISFNDTSLAQVWVYENLPLRFGTNQTERMRITSDGNVGIGTSSPSRKLTIQSDTNTSTALAIKNNASTADGLMLEVDASANTFIWNYSATPMLFGTNSTERMRITSGGNIGIGTNSPSTALHVAGTTTTTALSLDAGYGSAAPVFGCRAWVNINGTTNANVSATYSQSGTTVTVTLNNHGHLVDHVVSISFSSGSGVAGFYRITGVTTNTFTYTAGTSIPSTSGNCSLIRAAIRGSGNIHSVAFPTAGVYSLNFLTPFPDTNYSVVGSSGGAASTSNGSVYLNDQYSNKTAVTATIATVNTAGTVINTPQVQVAVFR